MISPLALGTVSLLLFALGCTAAPAPVASEPKSEPDPNENSWTPQSPQEKWWEAAQPCPEGAKLVGALPPKGNNLECVAENGKRDGLSSAWFGSGHAGTLAEYKQGVLDGRWLYWLHGQKLIEGQHEQGRRHGEWTFWFDAGGRFDRDARMSTHDWSKNYVVEQYDHGLLVSTTEYRDGKKVP